MRIFRINTMLISLSKVLMGVLFASTDIQNDIDGQKLSPFFIYETWNDIQSDEEPLSQLQTKKVKYQTADYNDFSKNPFTSKRQKKRLRPYLMPANHPIKPALDAIFTTQRVTANELTFTNAGFTILSTQPRSFIVVGRHPKLPGYLVKAYLDNETRQKQGHPGWVWLANRCKGAQKIEKVIKQFQFNKFTVAKKWIYPLPLDPPPLVRENRRRYNEILVVTDMKLAPKEESLNAWLNMTKSDLDALYTIICSAGGSSYREDNIPYTQDGRFAFVDTEYPDKIPNFNSILRYLSPEMQAYWNKLVKKGGAF